MEAQVYELQQKASFTSEVKSTLDAWVRHEASVREQEQKRLVAEVMDKVAQELKDPKVQQAILNQAVADVEKIAAKA
jgi:F-type H+-transporting ATPase subunit b